MKPDEFMHAKEHGWRYFVNLGCYMQAAVLIDIYLKTHPGLNDDFKPVMSFYGGQMFALSGNSETAVEFLRAAYREGSGEGNTAWNLFIDGLIAFHERDKNKLRASRDLLINAKSAHQEFDPSLLDRLLDGFNEPFLKTYLELARMEDPAGQTGHKR
ncbi:MAG: hypothetical protein MJA83_01820 [Gammaproteobacteria bacterium]|nr:hypothetical protein [Gammaproteobacteria bacterium]